MDLENINCPQFVSFGNELFETKEADVSRKEPLNQVLTSGNKENFAVHTCSRKSCSVKLKTRTTVPKPFRFETDNRIKGTEAKGSTVLNTYNGKRNTGYFPLAEQLVAFQKKTPDRFHSSSRKDFKSKPSVLKKQETLKSVVSAENAIGIKLDPAVKSEKLRLKNVAVSKETANRKIEAKSVPNTNAKQKENYVFRARPVPKNILSGPVGLGKKPKVVHTVAKSPNFVTGKRLEKRKLLEQTVHDIEENPTKKAKLVIDKPPVSNKVTKPKITKVQPFNFDKTSKKFPSEERGVQKETEKYAKPFVFTAESKALPKKSMIPRIHKKSASQPFNFCSDKRTRKTDVPEPVKFEPFKAQPAKVLNRKPFVPEKQQKPKIAFKEFNLRSSKLAVERSKVKEQREKPLCEKKAVGDEIEQRKIQQLRRTLVIKSTPIRHPRPIQIRRSSRPTTIPISPNFATNKRFLPKLRESKYFGLI